MSEKSFYFNFRLLAVKYKIIQDIGKNIVISFCLCQPSRSINVSNSICLFFPAFTRVSYVICKNHFIYNTVFAQKSGSTVNKLKCRFHMKKIYSTLSLLLFCIEFPYSISTFPFIDYQQNDYVLIPRSFYYILQEQ